MKRIGERVLRSRGFNRPSHRTSREMAPQGKKRIGGGETSRGIISAVWESSTVSDTAYVTNKLLRSTGKAAWMAGTTFLILFVPIIVAMDREQQLNEIESQQTTLLGAPPA